MGNVAFRDTLFTNITKSIPLSYRSIKNEAGAIREFFLV